MKLICKIVGHSMYNIVWNQTEFTVLCKRCEKQWQSKGVILND